MKNVLLLALLLTCSAPIRAQYWSVLHDNVYGALDAVRFIDATEDQVLVMEDVLDVSEALGGFSFKRLGRAKGQILCERTFLFQDSVCSIGGVFKINANKYVLLYTTRVWSISGNGYHNIHYVDACGNTLSKYRFGNYNYPLSLRGVAKTSSGFLLASTTTPTWATSNSHMEYVGFNGESRWGQTVIPLSTRSFDDALSINDTLVLLQNSGTGPRIFLFDTLGNELARSETPGHEDYYGTDLLLSNDSTRWIISGFIRPETSNPQAIMILDRGLNELDFNTWIVGTGGTGRAVAENRFGDLLFVGHARVDGVFGDRDNAFVMCIEKEGLVEKTLTYFSPSGILNDDNIQIVISAEIEDSILYIAGHGGITDTTGSQDAWILALTDLGTCDTADCFPWLISGLVEVPAEWMEQWTVGTGTDAWHVHMEQPALWRQGARWVLYDRTGKRLRDVPADGPELRLPYDGIPSGPYILEWRRDHQRMARRIARP